MSTESTNSATAKDELLYTVNEHIGTVTFNRPQARNALTFAMYDRLAGICRGAAGEGVRALVITGAGDKAFAAGTDISRFREFRTAADALSYETRIDAVLGAIETCPVPVIAALGGACTGGGAGIAAACDLRVTARTLRFGFPIARTLGNCLSASTLSRLAALLGAGRTRELVFTARLMGADEALAAGLGSGILGTRAAGLHRAHAGDALWWRGHRELWSPQLPGPATKKPSRQ